MQSERILRMLPQVFQSAAWEGSPLLGLTAAMEALHAPSEQVLDELDAYFDPRRAPSRFVPYLASWVDLDRIVRGDGGTEQAGTLALPTGRLRELTAAAAELSRWRGTAHGLARFLEIATGVQGFHVDDRVEDAYGEMRPFHLDVHVPPQAAGQWALIETIVAEEKPAYVTSGLRLLEGPNGAAPDTDTESEP